MKDPNGTPDAAEFGLLRAFLGQQSFPQQWIKDHTGDPSEFTRAEYTALIIEGQKILPKAT